MDTSPSIGFLLMSRKKKLMSWKHPGKKAHACPGKIYLMSWKESSCPGKELETARAHVLGPIATGHTSCRTSKNYPGDRLCPVGQVFSWCPTTTGHTHRAREVPTSLCRSGKDFPTTTGHTSCRTLLHGVCLNYTAGHTHHVGHS